MQGYIVARIINARYNVGEFADFLDTKKEGSGSNISLLTSKEMVSYIDEFIG